MTRAEEKHLWQIQGKGSACATALALFLKSRGHKTTKPSTKARREKKKLSGKGGEWDLIKTLVLTRSRGQCEFFTVLGGRCATAAIDVDHWLNGNGRRRQKQHVENCWALCRYHHNARQTYRPSVAYWNARFADHCSKWGYPFVPHIEHEPLGRRPGQAIPPAVLEKAAAFSTQEKP